MTTWTSRRVGGLPGDLEQRAEFLVRHGQPVSRPVVAPPHDDMILGQQNGDSLRWDHVLVGSWVKGTSAATVVPMPGADSIERFPPTISIRSLLQSRIKPFLPSTAVESMRLAGLAARAMGLGPQAADGHPPQGESRAPEALEGPPVNSRALSS